MSAAHPLLGNLLIGGSVWLGHAIFGSYNAGLALYSCLQAACVTAVFAYTLCFMIRHCVPRLAVLISAVFFACNSFFHVFVFTTIKENLFGAALLMLFLFTVDLILSPDRFFKSKALQARYIGMALLMCLLRNQGIFLLVLMIPFVVWACRIKRIRLAGLCLSAVALYYALTLSLIHILIMVCVVLWVVVAACLAGCSAETTPLQSAAQTDTQQTIPSVSYTHLARI